MWGPCPRHTSVFLIVLSVSLPRGEQWILDSEVFWFIYLKTFSLCGTPSLCDPLVQLTVPGSHYLNLVELWYRKVLLKDVYDGKCLQIKESFYLGFFRYSPPCSQDAPKKFILSTATNPPELQMFVPQIYIHTYIHGILWNQFLWTSPNNKCHPDNASGEVHAACMD